MKLNFVTKLGKLKHVYQIRSLTTTSNHYFYFNILHFSIKAKEPNILNALLVF